MTSNGSMHVGGAVTFSSLSAWTRRDALLSGLTALGWNKAVPESRSNAACLKSALSSVFKEKGQLVQPLESDGAYEVIQVERGGTRNNYNHLFCVNVDDCQAVHVNPYDYDVATKIVEEFNLQLGLLGASQVTGCLVGILKYIGGVSLRPKGGIYEVPANRVEEWAKIGKAVDVAGHLKDNAVYIIRHVMDGDAIRAVRDAITAEVKTRSQEIRAEVTDLNNPLGARGMAHREQEARDLMDKVHLYEELLGVGLDDLRATLDQVETTVAQAAVLAACV